jgi:fatty acid desaturase
MAPTSSLLLERDALASLNTLRDGPGSLRLVTQLLMIGLGGLVWAQQGWPLALRLPGLLLCGIGLATCFAPLHECGHRTAFRSRRLNDSVAWIAEVFPPGID